MSHEIELFFGLMQKIGNKCQPIVITIVYNDGLKETISSYGSLNLAPGPLFH